MLGRADSGTLARLTEHIGVLIAKRASFLIFTVLSIFFLLRDGAEIGRRCHILSVKMLGDPGEHLANLVVQAVRSTADGLVLVGLGEGVVLGAAYALAGLPHSILVGGLTGLLAMIPFGAPVIFSVAALYLLLTGNLAGALGVFAFGWVVLFVADHIIRPVLIGGGAKLPFLWVLLGIFGGLATFGLLGLFLGPALMAALVSLWREWTEHRSADANRVLTPTA